MKEWANVVHTPWHLSAGSATSLTAIALSCFQLFSWRCCESILSSLSDQKDVANSEAANYSKK